MARNGLRTKKTILALTALMLLIAPYLVSLGAWAVDPVVADPPTAATDAGTLAPAGANLTNTDTKTYNDPSTNTVSESAEQDKTNVITNTTNTLMAAIDTRAAGQHTDVYNGMAAWVGDDIFSNLFSNIGQVIGRWLSEFIDGWISSTVQFLAAFLRTFVLNPNIAVNGVQNTPGAQGGQPDDISPYVREAAGTMYGIAIDLLLLLFILCIWKFWAEAAWRGGGHLLGAVGRLIFTAGLMLAWPTIYAFEIQITNEMIQAIYFTGGDQITQLDVALTAAVKAGLVATTGLLANAFAPVIGGAVGGAVGGTVGGVIAFAGLIIYLILGVVLITQIVYILVLKAIQTGLLTAQYMFAPIFLVFFATPDTENVTSGFVKSFIEVSLWTFVWVGLLKIMVIILYSQFNPWGKITMAVGILQLMISVPTFLARAQISPMSDFVSAGLATGGLLKMASFLSKGASGAMTQFARYTTSDQFAARGMPTSKKVGMENTPTGAANPELMNSLKSAGQGVTPGGTAGKGGAPGALGQDLANPLNKVPAKKDADALKNKLGENGLGPDGKAISPLGAKKDSDSAAALRKMSPAQQAAAAGLLTGVGVAVGAGAAAGEASSAMNAAGGKGMSGDDAKARAAADKASAGIPVAGMPGVEPPKAQTEAEKAAAKAANLNQAAKLNPLGAAAVKTAATGNKLNPDGTPKLNPDGTTTAPTVQSLASGTTGDAAKDAAAAKTGVAGKEGGPPIPPPTATTKDATGTVKDATGKDATGKDATATAATAASLAALASAVPVAGAGIKKPTPPGVKPPDATVAGKDATTLGGADAGDKTKQQQTVQSLATGTTGGEEVQGVHTNVVGVDGTKATPPKAGQATTSTGAEGADKGAAAAAAAGLTALAAAAPVAGSIKKPGAPGVKAPDGTTTGKDATTLGGADAGDKTKQQQTVQSLATGTNGGEEVQGVHTNVVSADGTKATPPKVNQGTTTTGADAADKGTPAALAALAAVAPVVAGAAKRPGAPGAKAPDASGRAATTPGGVEATGDKTVQHQTVQSLATGTTGGEEVQGMHTNVVSADGTKATPPKVNQGTTTTGADAADRGTPAALAALAAVAPVVAGAAKRSGASGIKAPDASGRAATTPGGAETTGDKSVQHQTVQSLATGTTGGEEVQGVHTNVVAADGTKAAPPKFNQGATTVDAGRAVESGAGASPLTALAAGAVTAGSLTAAGRRSGLLGGGRAEGRGVQTTGSSTGGSIDGGRIEQTTRVPVSAGSEDSAMSVNNVVTAEGMASRPGQTRMGAQTTTLGAAGAPAPAMGADGVPNLAALASLPPVMRQPGETAFRGKRSMATGGSRAVESANSRPAMNNGSNPDPMTVRQAVSTPAGGVPDRGGQQNVNMEQVNSGRANAATGGAAGTPVFRQTGSAAGTEFNPAVSAMAGLSGAALGAAAGAAARTAASGGGGGGGQRNISMPGAPGGGSGGGNNGGNESAYVSFSSPGGGPTRGGRPVTTDGMTNFDQANYRWVPGRSLLTDIRTAAGPQQGDAADGQSAISMGQRGVASVRYGQGATSEQKALMLMTAGYAGVFSQDPVAFDAARQSAIDAGGDKPKGFAQQIASNWLQYSGGSFKSTAVAKNQFQQSLMEQATLGSESYVNGSTGNAYTSYLRGRYGPMTADQQAWGMHITSDPSSPESGWSTTVGPATDTLVKAGMPITAENRAAASNQAVMRQPQWARGQAVRGVAAYLGAMADESLGPNAHPLERDAFVGRLAPQLSSETVEACRAIVAEAPNGQGAALCARPDYVNSVASLMASPDSPRKLDASTAFRNMSGVMRGGSGNAVGMQTIDVLSSNGGGGYSGGSIGGGMAAAPPPPPMAGGFGNTVIDAQYREMAGGGQGNFSAPSATVYAPNNSALGNTIVRGSNGGLNFANQTVHANMDILPSSSSNSFNMPTNLGSQVAGGVSQTDVNVSANIVGGGGNANLPPSLGTQLGPNITSSTDVNLNTTSGGDDNAVHNVDMNVMGAAGRQEMNIRGGAGGSGSINRTEMNVHAEVIAPNGPVSLPPVGQFASMQDVQTQSTANVTMGSSGGAGGGGGTYVQQGLAQVFLNPSANASQQSNYLNSTVAQMGAQAAHSYSSNYQSAQQVVIEMMRAGFDDNAIQNPGIASVAMQTYQQDPSMLGSAAIASKVMQPQEVTMETVQVVQQMVDAGWSPKNITRPDVLTSQMIVQTGAFGGAPGYGYPDPQHVRQVRQHPNFVPEYTRGAAARGAVNQIPADLMDAMSGGGGDRNDRGPGGGGGGGRR